MIVLISQGSAVSHITPFHTIYLPPDQPCLWPSSYGDVRTIRSFSPDDHDFCCEKHGTKGSIHVDQRVWKWMLLIITVGFLPIGIL
jgi:hypothetical protein